MANKKQLPSIETQNEAMRIAKATQKPGQSKEQTKLIAQGIQKGIELYKKQQKQKSRERDKFKKKQQKQKDNAAELQPTTIEVVKTETTYKQHWLPWGLLVLSWAGFILYLTQGKL